MCDGWMAGEMRGGVEDHQAHRQITVTASCISDINHVDHRLCKKTVTMDMDGPIRRPSPRSLSEREKELEPRIPPPAEEHNAP